MRVRHMGGVNVGAGALNVDVCTAEAARPSICGLRRQREARLVHCIFPGRPSALASILFKVTFRAIRQLRRPGGFKIGPSLVKRLGRPIDVLAAMRHRVEAALPTPDQHRPEPGSSRDRAHANVAEIDVPAVLAFWISAAGEDGHGPLKRSVDAVGKLAIVVVRYIGNKKTARRWSLCITTRGG